MGAAETLKTKMEDLPKVLIVDDHYVTAEIERNFLMQVGFQVFIASNASEVTEIVTHELIDLIIIDANFAKKQGLTILKNAKRMSKNTEMKGIVKSVEAMPAARKNAESFGADGYLVMPAPRPKFLREIKKLTSQKTRDSERVKQNIEIQMVVNEEDYMAHTMDLSSEGAHLKLDGEEKEDVVPVGTHVTLLLHLAQKKKATEITGVVVRHTAEGFGIRFDDLDRNAKRDLDKFILKNSMEQRASQFYL